MSWREWAKEPLVHFLIGGLIIYALFAWRGEPIDTDSRSIEIGREAKAQVALAFEQLMGRPPTDAELDRQVERYIREEVLYREALRIGLDENDAVVRRRMAQKMDLIAAAQAEAAQPSDDTLQSWFEAHPERFADQAKYSLDQVYFAEKSGAEALMAQLNAQTSQGDFTDKGQPISLPSSLEGMARKEVLDRFGEQFLAGISGLEISEKWQGPMASGFGWHIIRLRAREVGALPAFDDVRTRVENDWRSNTIEERRRRAYAILRDAYRIEIAD